MRIVIHGHLGMGNLGDELMLGPVLDVLRQRFPAATLTTVAGHHTPAAMRGAYPRVRFVPRSAWHLCKEIARSNVIVIAGGTHIASFIGAKRHFRGIIRQVLLVLWARLTFTRVLMLSVGFGPFEEPRGEGLARLLVRLTTFISVRDDASAEWLVSTGRAPGTYARCHDAALLTRRVPRKAEEPMLGISLLPYFANYGDGGGEDDTFVARMVEVIRHWRRIYPKGPVELLSFLKQDSPYSDDRVLRPLHAAFAADGRVRLVDRYPDVEYAQKCFATFTHVVSMRYHSQVMAWLNDVPQLCIAYHQKNLLFAADSGIRHGQCFGVTDVLDGKLGEACCDFFLHPEEYHASRSIDTLGVDADLLLPVGVVLSSGRGDVHADP